MAAGHNTPWQSRAVGIAGGAGRSRGDLDLLFMSDKPKPGEQTFWGRMVRQGTWQERRGSEDARRAQHRWLIPAISTCHIVTALPKGWGAGAPSRQSQAAAGLTIAAFRAVVLPQRRGEGPGGAGTAPVPKEGRAGQRELQRTAAMANSRGDSRQTQRVPRARPLAARVFGAGWPSQEGRLFF